MKKIYVGLFLFWCLVPITSAQKGQSEWEQFRLTDYDREVAAGLREVQGLIQGREALRRSYEQTDQGAIETERAIEKLHQDRINTRKAELAYYEAMVNFKFPEYQDTEEPLPDTTDSDTDFFDGLNEFLDGQVEIQPAQEPTPPPRFRLHYVKELSESELEFKLENFGGETDAIVSLLNQKGSTISNPYQKVISDWGGTRYVSFRLRSPANELTLMIETDDRTLKIPLFLRNPISAPRIIAFPHHQSARLGGDPAEYTLTVEGDPADRRKHKISISNLPYGIEWQIHKIIPAITPEALPRTILIRNLQFSRAFNLHELALQLTLSRDLPKKLIGKQIQFTLRIGSARETLSIMPIGIGKLSLDLPSIVVVEPGKENEIYIRLNNTGTEPVHKISIRHVGSVFGIDAYSRRTITLAPGEEQDLPITIETANDISVGQHKIQLVLLSSAGSQTVDLDLVVEKKKIAFGNASQVALAGALVIIGLLYGVTKFEQFRRARKPRGEKSNPLKTRGGSQ